MRMRNRRRGCASQTRNMALPSCAAVRHIRWVRFPFLGCDATRLCSQRIAKPHARECEGPRILRHTLEEAVAERGVGNPTGDIDQLLARIADRASRGVMSASRMQRLSVYDAHEGAAEHSAAAHRGAA